MGGTQVNGSLTFDFTGSVAVVTGAARGIGRALVQAFVGQGANTVAVDRDREGLDQISISLGKAVAVVTADVRNSDDVEKVIATAEDRFGGLDICVNNAAVAPHASLLEERRAVWDTVYAVNCRGTFLMTQAAANAMIEKGRGGRIVNFSSAASRRGSPGSAAYASSRAAVESFTRVAAIELAPHGILVNTVRPGLIDTQPRPRPPLMAESLSARIPTLPLARPGLPEEVVQVVLFLASSGASYITGAVISVDGGASVGKRPDGPIVDDDPRYDWVVERQSTT
jgi:NAD(P)-dependent dehydrogenase (short-subunit alcohol dehydrogenase family)